MADQTDDGWAELRRLLANATPAPWRNTGCTPWGSQVIFNESGEMFLGVSAYTAPPGDRWSRDARRRALDLGAKKGADAALIVRLRNEADALLAERDALAAARPPTAGEVLAHVEANIKTGRGRYDGIERWSAYDQRFVREPVPTPSIWLAADPAALQPDLRLVPIEETDSAR